MVPITIFNSTFGTSTNNYEKETPKRFDNNDKMRVPEKGKDPARIIE
jgi:hypothetical protein